MASGGGTRPKVRFCYAIILLVTNLCMFIFIFQTTYPYRSPSRDSGVESVADTRDRSGAPRHPSDYVNTSRVPGGVSSLANHTPPLPPRQWRRVTQADLFRPVQDEPVGGDQDEDLGSGGPDNASGENLIDLDGVTDDNEPGDVISDLEESSGDQGKGFPTSTMVPIFEVTQPPRVIGTQAPGLVERKGILVESDWSPEARGSVPRPTVPFDVYIETRHAEGNGDTRYYWMESCESTSVTTRRLTREDYFCLVGSFNMTFSFYICFCDVTV